MAKKKTRVSDDADAAARPDLPLRDPIPFPFFPLASGLYEYTPFLRPIPHPPVFPGPLSPVPVQGDPALPSGATLDAEPEAVPPAGFGDAPDASVGGEPEALTPIFPWWSREELRLDVDGRYPQMTASGTLNSAKTRVHWIASLAPAGVNRWTGRIWYKDGNTSALPQTSVTITVVRSWFTNQRKATVTFTGGGAAKRTRTFRWKSPYFHPVELEFDREAGETAVTVVDTHDHPNRPAGLPQEDLSIDTVFRRAGFDVSHSGGGSGGLTGTGANSTWSDQEMHDAMQIFWSRFDNKAAWSMWVLFANQHDSGSSLGGIMFDDIGPNHRQGTAMFNNSFIADAPLGDADPAAWVKRMKFWTAVHEMGHAFNLAHSWQKSLSGPFGSPWIPLADEPEARSFMNYPFNVAGGETAFFANFEYRFSDQELLFLRHAPERFVQMGNADWFDDHGFEQVAVDASSPLRLEVRCHRSQGFEFLEPVNVELKLENTSNQPQLVDASILEPCDHLTVILKRDGQPARQWRPYSRHFHRPEKTVLQPGEAIYGSLRVSAGVNGWDIAEPGYYTVQVALHRRSGALVSNPLRVRVAPPRSWDEEYVAQDLFSEDAGRALAFGGTLALDRGNDVLREVASRLPKSAAARHAALALAMPLTRDYKLLDLPAGADATSAAAAGGKFTVRKAKTGQARKDLEKVLTTGAGQAVETFGHIDFQRHVDALTDLFAADGEAARAAECQATMRKAYAGRGVLRSVVDGISRREKALTKAAAGKALSKPKRKAAKKAPRRASRSTTRKAS